MKRHILLLCLSLGALAGPVAQAQVHRCSTASGATVYSDAPCSEGQTGRLIERHKSPEELQQERAQAAAANDRQARERTAERLRQDVLSTVPERSAAAAPLPSDSPACKSAQKELQFVSSIRTISEDEKRLRVNAAITQVNAACGSQTPLMQEPARVIVVPPAYGHGAPTR